MDVFENAKGMRRGKICTHTLGWNVKWLNSMERTKYIYIYLASVLRLIYFLKTSSKSFTIGKESHCSRYNSFQLRQKRATYMDNGQN